MAEHFFIVLYKQGEMTENQNEREFTRVPLHLQVEIDFGGKKVKVKQTHDLSMKGVFVECDEIFEVGAECQVSMILAGSDQPIRVDIKGQVERSTEGGLGIEFTEIGLESYDHLQNLVRFNSHDSGQVEKEIKDHLGLKRR
ncbi:hypothetical protein UR09_02640 [Candidatus Nitromaritima sp. SCGC AAA799-A02]|nr:hypothetical protein UR09_02640 [Candidatus Nitromaritima sp. SCGC AAA799-A02]KMP11875.1 hypothetical protein UZ36_02860 [Candidatus Nitromaritima sp. SCGC AAA799-C22]